MCDYVAIKRMNGIDRLYLFYDISGAQRGAELLTRI